MKQTQLTEEAKNLYPLDCTGDVCKGDEICFIRDVWGGSYKKPKHLGYEQIMAVVINESYGTKKQQHTFTLMKADQARMLIKGRNLYKYAVHRKPWDNERDRLEVIKEKHLRGDSAREARSCRIKERGF